MLIGLTDEWSYCRKNVQQVVTANMLVTEKEGGSILRMGMKNLY